MSNLIAKTTGNFTASTSWGVADTTFLKTDGTVEATVATGYSYSTSHVPGAIEVDGILLQISKVGASKSNVLDVMLRNVTDSVTEKTVTINVADLPDLFANGGYNGGWFFFKFDAAITLTAGKSYALGVRCPSGLQVYCRRDATANNWNRMLRTTTEAAPSAGDNLFISGQFTGAGASTAVTITGDNNNTTVFGSLNTATGGTYTTSVAGNTKIILAGFAYNYGTLNIGTNASPIPLAYTADFFFTCASNGQYGLINFGTFTAQGASRTFRKSLLSGNVSAGGTSLTLADSVDTAWRSGDEIVLPSTTRTYAESELRTMSAHGSGTGIAIDALSYAHDGVTPYIGEVANITNNVKIESTHASYFAYVNFVQGTIDCDWATFSKLNNGGGSSGYAISFGVDSSLNVSMEHCVVRDCTLTNTRALNIMGLHASATLILNDNVLWNNVIPLYNAGTNNTTYEITNNLFIKQTTMSTLYDMGGKISGNTWAGNNAQQTIFVDEAGSIGEFKNNTCHSANASIYINEMTVGIIENYKSWRGEWSVYLNGSTNDVLHSDKRLVFLNPDFRGNNDSAILVAVEPHPNPIDFVNLIFEGDAVLGATSKLLRLEYCSLHKINFYSAQIGLTYPPNYIVYPQTDRNQVFINFYDCDFGYNTAFFDPSRNPWLDSASYIKSSRHNGVAGDYKSWNYRGALEREATIFRTATPSESMQKTSYATTSALKLESSQKHVALNSGETATVSVYIYKGASYDGNEPRLIVKRNDAMGITADTVLATASGSAETWLLLSGTTSAVTEDGVLDFVVDIDGIGTDKVYVDDWHAVLT